MLAQSTVQDWIGTCSAVDPSLLPDLDEHVRAVVKALPEDCTKAFTGDERLAKPIAAAAAQRFGFHDVINEMDTGGGVLTVDTLSSTASSKPNLPANHEIRRVSFPQDEPHKDMLADMHAGTYNETRGRVVMERDTAAKAIQEAAARADLWAYWVDGVPVVSTVLARPTGTGKSVQVVFTRPEFRRRGLAEVLLGDVCRKPLMGEEDVEKLEHIVIFYLYGGSAGRIYNRVGFGSKDGATFRQANMRLK